MFLNYIRQVFPEMSLSSVAYGRSRPVCSLALLFRGSRHNGTSPHCMKASPRLQRGTVASKVVRLSQVQNQRRHVVSASALTQRQEANTSKQLRVTHILLPKDQREHLAELKERIEGGEDMARLAAEYSKCPSGRRGGDLGWISEGATVVEFEQAAFGAARDVGTLVTARTPFGLHLLKVTDTREVHVVRPMSVEELGELLGVVGTIGAEEADVQLLDVREEMEYDMAALPHFKLLPLSRFDQWSAQLKDDFDPSKETIVLCHHGVRSMQVASYLISQGFCNVKNVTGGIDAYTRVVDSSVPAY